MVKRQLHLKTLLENDEVSIWLNQLLLSGLKSKANTLKQSKFLGCWFSFWTQIITWTWKKSCMPEWISRLSEMIVFPVICDLSGSDPFFGMILARTFFSRLCHWLTVQKCGGYLVTLTNSRMLQIFLLWSYWIFGLDFVTFWLEFFLTKDRWLVHAATITFLVASLVYSKELSVNQKLESCLSNMLYQNNDVTKAYPSNKTYVIAKFVNQKRSFLF